MEVRDAICARASVREFKREPIGRDQLEKLVDAGRRAPSARAVEPWEFVVVTQDAVLKRLGALANTGKFIADSAACIAVFCRDSKYFLRTAARPWKTF